MHQLAGEVGRDPATLDLAFWSNWDHEMDAQTLENGERHIFTGGAEATVDDIGALKDRGFNHALFNFQRESLEASLDAMRRFAADIMPKFR